MDELDRKILRLLSADGRMTVKDIARQVSLTSPAVSERIRRMEKTGVIAGYTVVLGDAEPKSHIVFPQLPGTAEAALHTPAKAAPAFCHGPFYNPRSPPYPHSPAPRPQCPAPAQAGARTVRAAYRAPP